MTELLELLQPENSEPRNKPLSIPVNETDLQFYRDTCEMVKKLNAKKSKDGKGKNTLPFACNKLIMDFCKKVREHCEQSA
jgi:hypothetical protein